MHSPDYSADRRLTGGQLPADYSNERLMARCLPCIHPTWLAVQDVREGEL
jgi:hypothetical protein